MVHFSNFLAYNLRRDEDSHLRCILIFCTFFLSGFFFFFFATWLAGSQYLVVVQSLSHVQLFATP